MSPLPAVVFPRSPEARLASLTTVLATTLLLLAPAVAQPTLSNVRAVPRAGTKLVDITYNLAHPTGLASNVRVEVSQDNGTTYAPASAVSGAVGAGITPGNNRTVVWNAGAEWLSTRFSGARVRVRADDSATAATHLPIPGGTFTMGDSNDGVVADERPTHQVTLTAFFLQQTETTYESWREVFDWNASGNRGYVFAAGRRGSTVNLTAVEDTPEGNRHPVTFVSWWDVVIWCNARSRKEGLTPCYYLDAAFTTEFRSGTPSAVFCNFAASGYRLPTESEWEYAARGGLAAQRYPWGNTIAPGQANYGGGGPATRPPFSGTSPVGYFNGAQSPAGPDMKNGYGLYDVAGNVSEWVWDYVASYTAEAKQNPRGPDTGTFRGLRGGNWLQSADSCRVSNREVFTPPTASGGSTGFRTARSFLSLTTAALSESSVFALDLRNAGDVPSSRLANLSVRTALASDQTLIVGFVVNGGSRSVLVRAVGPALSAFGVTRPMDDPQLELYNGNTRIFANDNWPANLATTFAAVGAFALNPGSRDAALLQPVSGARSILARGAGAGVVLVEAYDTDTGNTPRLVNVSARNRVGTGDDILIAGFTIAGTGPKQVLIRAVGPSLRAFAVTDFLLDPVLEVYAGGVRLDENDNWSASLAPVFTSVSAFPFAAGSRDAALVLVLLPGSYTAQVRGVGGTTGESLVELYELADTLVVRR